MPLTWMTMATVVYGNRGTGKSTLGRVMAEEVSLRGQRFCAIDPTGAWWGLKSSESGTEEGLPVVIFGGDHADVPLEPGSGAELADIVAEIDQSAILDLEHLSKGRQIVFVGAFLERLYHVNRDPLLLLMDEAQRYAPQKPMSPDANRTLGATEDVVKLGRKHGLGPVVFTQRGSGLNKEVSELADVLVAFRTPGVIDQRRVEDWLEANVSKAQKDEVMARISSLSTGTAIFASSHPGLTLMGDYAVRQPRTFDSSATPVVGQKRSEPRTLSKPDIEALSVRMAAAIERGKADDPKELRKKIRELEGQLIEALRVQQVEKVVETQKLVPLLSGRDMAEIRRLADVLEAITEQVDVVDEVQLRTGPLANVVGIEDPPRPARKPIIGEIVAVGDPPRPHVAREPVAGYQLRTAELRLLSTVAVNPDGLTMSRLATLAGYSVKSSGLGVALGNLRKLGLIERGTPIRITEEGKDYVPEDVELPPPPGPALIDYWLRKLGTAEQRILRVMADAHPEQLSMEQIAERAGYSVKSSGLGVAIAKLRSTKLIDGFEVSEALVGR